MGIDDYCTQRNFTKMGKKLQMLSGIDDIHADNSPTSYIISILYDLDFIKHAIGNINDRLTALEKVGNE